ncbi:hypothetical protein ACWGNE_19250 [Streptomyces xiamenensis]
MLRGTPSLLHPKRGLCGDFSWFFPASAMAGSAGVVNASSGLEAYKIYQQIVPTAVLAAQIIYR